MAQILRSQLEPAGSNLAEDAYLKRMKKTFIKISKIKELQRFLIERKKIRDFFLKKWKTFETKMKTNLCCSALIVSSRWLRSDPAPV
jgi:hypothetical protein